VSENRVLELYPDGTHGDAVRVPLPSPFTSFMTTTERGGSPPGPILEVLGAASGLPGLSYARINLLNKIRADFTSKVGQDEGASWAELDAGPSLSAEGEVTSWEWDLGGEKAAGQRVRHTFTKSGPVEVSLTVKDGAGQSATARRTIQIPPTPGDFGLRSWGAIIRTQAESFVAEGGGEIHVRNDKLASSGLSLSHWDTNGHRLEWELDLPAAGRFFLLLRYATPARATRELSVDGETVATLGFAPSGGYGSQTEDNWAFVPLTAESGSPTALELTAGRHTIGLQNTDGTGLNLDYLDWIAEDSGTPMPDGFRIVDDNGHRYGLPLSGVLVPGRITQEIGHCFTYSLGPLYPGDGVPGGPASTLRLLEDGKELGPAHAPHVEVREQGEGRYSHWVTGIWFSASDNSDPRSNGRRYTWELSE